MQHPLEVAQTKGTGRLLHLNLTNSHLIAGELLTEDTIARISNPQRRSVLLYPDSAEHAPIANPQTIPTDLRLIIVDATWRKSRKMLHLNPLLNTLPRLSLRDPPASRYAIRKAHQPHQLSTLEATCHALLQLGESPSALQTLLTSFDGFVAQQESYRNDPRNST